MKTIQKQNDLFFLTFMLIISISLYRLNSKIFNLIPIKKCKKYEKKIIKVLQKHKNIIMKILNHNLKF